MNLKDFKDRIANPAGAKADGAGYDLIATNNGATLLGKKDLGYGPSDHRAWLYKVRIGD